MTVLHSRDWRREDEAVYFTDSRAAGLDRAAIDFLRAKLPGTPRQRIRVCTHADPGAAFQEMVIALGASGYVRPHRHHGKAESLHVIEGRAMLVLFDDDGRVAERIPLDSQGSAACWYYRIEEPVYHTLLPETDAFVFHESTTGPFRREETEFAPWAPDESNGRAARAFQESLRKQLGMA